MSKEPAAADRAAAAYWRQVARADRSKATTASANARKLTDAARREEPEASEREATGRTSRLRPGS